MSLKSFTTYVTKTIEHFYVTKMYCNGLKFTATLVAISLQFNGQKEQQTHYYCYCSALQEERGDQTVMH